MNLVGLGLRCKWEKGDVEKFLYKFHLPVQGRVARERVKWKTREMIVGLHMAIERHRARRRMKRDRGSTTWLSV